jgi:hypothetical protein
MALPESAVELAWSTTGSTADDRAPDDDDHHNLTARSVVCAETSCGCRAAQSVAEADPRPIKPAISARDPPITYARTTSSFLPA